VASLGPAATTELIETTFDYRARDTRPRQRAALPAHAGSNHGCISAARPPSSRNPSRGQTSVRIRHDLHPPLLSPSLVLWISKGNRASEPTRFCIFVPAMVGGEETRPRKSSRESSLGHPHPLIRPRANLPHPSAADRSPAPSSLPGGRAGENEKLARDRRVFADTRTHIHIYIYIFFFSFFFFFHGTEVPLSRQKIPLSGAQFPENFRVYCS